ncbi:type II secretion system ATPase GspE [Xanthomonas perforans]|uniref:Type II secretion system protein E n=1 Tax=Xanthomonas perforans TaxID=442694 RepID=A0ABR5ET53_XANPE|nr:type II secretion system ATPase GspE [Xanthomonas perforans]KLC06178.1 general secretion pathway protein GspE [Xanthomonas perforans]KLC10929.1 general secretion pathway protein GspE [Xanthomonas perforans]KLC12876.1 general secretion pathway protein GspE [Xanthomonas perforans]KLC19426.1 general secretion pathway protein GspE [Xanthomonas perforans]KLC24452.1 general secretion pathway protein GspE [Xanthomonas perforans]
MRRHRQQYLRPAHVPCSGDAMSSARASISYAFAKRHGVVLLGSDTTAQIGLREGGDVQALIELRRALGMPLQVRTLAPPVFDRQVSEIYADAGLEQGVQVEALYLHGSLDSLIDDIPTADLLDSQDDAPIIRLINGIIAEAARLGASDVHLESYESRLRVRLRVDGVMREAATLPGRIAPLLVSRVKVMARLDIAEKRIPQDGRVSLVMGAKALDVRVSTLPTRGSERVVLRILDKEQGTLSLAQLGMPPAVMHTVQRALQVPNGIVLVTGPTGSGKTTTLYAALRLLNDGSRNILTVEDPVEYAIDGVGQTQVNARVGMTFAAGLRAILRQDPDVVMIGEIRDTETAQIAVQASLTGHLVLSTVHTNDAVGAVTRLRDMGIEPFLLASSLRLILAQRLVRRLCPQCRSERSIDTGTRQLLDAPADAVIYTAMGCNACHHSGYAGRVGIYEAIAVDDAMRRLIGDNADEDALAAVAFARAPRLGDAARAAVLQGLTTLEEALRVTRQQDDAHAAI